MRSADVAVIRKLLGKRRWIELRTFRFLHKLIKCRIFRLFVMIINQHPISTFQQLQNYAVYQAHYQHILGVEKVCHRRHLNCRLLQHETCFFPSLWAFWWHFQLHLARSFPSSDMILRTLCFEIFPLVRLEKHLQQQREAREIEIAKNNSFRFSSSSSLATFVFIRRSQSF